MTADTRLVYGVNCSWWGLIAETSRTSGGIPCCPHCCSVLFEVATETEWWANVDAHEAAGHPGYRAMIEWSRGKHFASHFSMERAYANRNEPPPARKMHFA